MSPYVKLSWFFLSFPLPSSLTIFLILIRELRAKLWKQQCLSHSTFNSTANYFLFLQNRSRVGSRLPLSTQQVIIMSCLDYCNNLVTVLPASALSPRMILFKFSQTRHSFAQGKDLRSQVLPMPFRCYSVSDLWPHRFATSSWLTLLQTHWHSHRLCNTWEYSCLSFYYLPFLLPGKRLLEIPTGITPSSLLIFTQLSSSHEAFPTMIFKIVFTFSLLSFSSSLLFCIFFMEQLIPI